MRDRDFQHLTRVEDRANLIQKIWGKLVEIEVRRLSKGKKGEGCMGVSLEVGACTLLVVSWKKTLLSGVNRSSPYPSAAFAQHESEIEAGDNMDAQAHCCPVKST